MKTGVGSLKTTAEPVQLSRPVESALAGALGDQAAISKSAVSAICGQIKDDYESWARRRLDGTALDYLLLDATFFRMHPGSQAEPVLAAWGITTVLALSRILKCPR